MLPETFTPPRLITSELRPPSHSTPSRGKRPDIAWIKPSIADAGNCFRAGSLDVFEQLRRAVADHPLAASLQNLAGLIDDLDFGPRQGNRAWRIRELVEGRERDDPGFR